MEVLLTTRLKALILIQRLRIEEFVSFFEALQVVGGGGCVVSEAVD